MSEIFGKVVFLIFILPTLMFKEGYPHFERYIEEKGWGEPKLFAAVFALTLFGLVLWGMGYR
ncbi:MAG: hypothetical protein ABIS26_01145 [Candidatus Paceibacterota bacterium]